MKKILFASSLIITFLSVAPSIYASTKPYLITEGFEAYSPYNQGYVLFWSNTFMNYQSGKIVLSSTPDGTGEVNIGDAVQFNVQPTDQALGNIVTFWGEEKCVNFHYVSAPLNITHLFKKDRDHNAQIRLLNWCDTTKHFSDLYFVNTEINDDPAPQPFLDLPWDYKTHNMSFADAALSITSYFDHEYPLLGSALSEPSEANQTIIKLGLDKFRAVLL